MKTLMVLAVVGLMAVVISAHRYGEQGQRNDDQDRHGDYRENKRWGGQREQRRYGDKGENHRWGGHRGGDKYRGSRVGGGYSGDDRRNRHWHSCLCRNQCDGNMGTKNIGCFKSRTQYLQCQDTTCSTQTCPDNQLFNFTTSLCEACPPGYHTDTYKRRCVCNQGTTFNYKTRTCGPCATGSITTADKCFCDQNTAFNKGANACQTCPEGSSRTRRGCSCTDPKLFWNDEIFSCQACPGEWISMNKTERRYRQRTVEVCQCQGDNQIFNKHTVTCVTCPANSLATVRYYKAYCQCTMPGQRYDYDTNKCVDRTSAFVNDDDDDDNDDADDEKPLENREYPPGFTQLG